MIRTLEDYITSDAMDNEYNENHPFVATEIPLDDKEVIELFHGTEVLASNRRTSTDVSWAVWESLSLERTLLSRW